MMASLFKFVDIFLSKHPEKGFCEEIWRISLITSVDLLLDKFV